MGGGASLEDRVLQKTSLNMDKSKEDSSSQNDEVPGDLPVFPKKKMLGRRPSEMVRSVLTLQKEQFEELEKKTLLRNPRLKKVFQGFEEVVSFLADDKIKNEPGDEQQHYAKLHKLLTDNVIEAFNTNSSDDERSVMGNKLAEIGFVKKLVDFYNFIMEEFGFDGVTDGFVEEAQSGGDASDMVILKAREILWNFSDSSHRFAEEIAETNMFEKLVIDLKEILKEGLQQIEMQDGRFAFNSSVGILHNCARNPNIDKGKFRSIGTVEILENFVKANNVYIKTITLLALGNMITEDEADRMHAGSHVLEFLMDAVKKALNSKDRKEYGFHLSELIDGLAALALSEQNKRLIMKENPMKTVKKIMSSQDSHEVVAVIKLAWELAFVEENKTKINGDQEFMEMLKKRINDKDKDVREVAKGALFVIEGMQKRTMRQDEAAPVAGVVPGTSRVDGKHIMFSYSWGDKEMVYKIYHELLSVGHSIWIDIEEMGKYANLLEGMAQAVEQAHTILVCFSEKYKNSQNCRTEAEYAFKLQKNFVPLKMQRDYVADGWLGAFIGARLFIEFTDKYPFDMKLKELKEHLPSSGGLPRQASSKNITVPYDRRTSVIAPKPPVGVPAGRSIQDWVKNDVEQWVVENNMSSNNFRQVKQLTGNQLRFLYTVYLKAPDTFYRWCEDKLKLKSLEDLMLFSNAIERLAI